MRVRVLLGTLMIIFKKNFFLWSGILVLILGSLIFLFKFFKDNSRNKINRFCFQNHCFEIEIADTSEKRARGLSFRQSLAGNRGMLFVFASKGRHSFWMKDMLFPLDIIWLDENYQAVFIKENAQPCQGECPSLVPDKEAKYVLEINAGGVKKIELELNDRWFFE